MVRNFVTNQGLKPADILCVFQGFQTAELVQNGHQLPQVILLLVASNNGGGHKPLNSAAEELRVCPMIPSARNREVWGLLAAEPAFAFAGTRSRSVTVRSFGYEPPSCQYGGWSVAAVRKTNNFLCPKTRPFIRTQKRPNLPQGVSASVSNVDFFRLTLAAPAYSLCTAIHIEEKVGPF